MIFNTVISFYNRKVVVIYVNVSREWSRERLLARGRNDDDSHGIEKRLDWFDKDTMPAVDHFKTDSNYNFLDINGEQSIEDVHKEILAKINF